MKTRFLTGLTMATGLTGILAGSACNPTTPQPPHKSIHKTYDTLSMTKNGNSGYPDSACVFVGDPSLLRPMDTWDFTLEDKSHVTLFTGQPGNGEPVKVSRVIDVEPEVHFYAQPPGFPPPMFYHLVAKADNTGHLTYTTEDTILGGDSTSTLISNDPNGDNKTFVILKENGDTLTLEPHKGIEADKTVFKTNVSSFVIGPGRGGSTGCAWIEYINASLFQQGATCQLNQ